MLLGSRSLFPPVDASAPPETRQWFLHPAATLCEPLEPDLRGPQLSAGPTGPSTTAVRSLELHTLHVSC